MSSAGTRERLLQAGQALIHRQGFGATGVQAIVQQAGVPKGSFYNHFASKEALGLAALAAYWQAAGEAFALLDDPDLAPRARITRHFGAVREMLRASGFDAGCMLGNLAAEAAPLSPPIRAQVSALFAQWTRLLAAAIAAGVADGSLRPAVPPEPLAGFLVAAWEGAVQRAKADQAEAPFESFFAVLDHLLG